MLTTIFTGHTLDLLDIVAVGCPMQELTHHGKGKQMYIEIFLRNSVPIRFVFHHQTQLCFNPAVWDKHLEDFLTKYKALIVEWKRELDISPQDFTFVTSDTQVPYQPKPSKKPKKGAEA